MSKNIIGYSNNLTGRDNPQPRFFMSGIIYIGISPSGKAYIGQHNTCNFDTRKKSHIRNYIEFLKKRCLLELNTKFNTSLPKYAIKGSCTALYTAFTKYGGFNSFKWTVLHTDVPLDKLNALEDDAIVKYNTLSPNGYNLKTNARVLNNFAYSEESRKRMSVSAKKKVKDNLHKYRKKHEQLEGLPQYVTYFESKGLRGYRIVRHPKCQSKQFADSTTPVEDLKKQTLEFLQKCELNPFETVQQKKAKTDVPKGITEQKPGRFLIQFGYKGKRYTKFFYNDDRSISLKNAIVWMSAKKEELKQQFENKE